MCSTSRFGDLFQSSGSGSGSAASSAKLIHRQQLKRDFAKYVVIDVREPDEHKADAIPDTTNIPLGALLHDASLGKLEDMRAKKIVTYCNIGYRSGIAARELSALGFSAVSLDMGTVGWKDPVACNWDFILVLTVDGHKDFDKLVTAASVVAASQKNSNNTALILMDEAVRVGVKGTLEEYESKLQAKEPFKQPKVTLEAFVKDGGMVFVCKSCMLSRQIALTDCYEWVRETQAPDVVRSLKSAGGSITF